MTPSSTRATGVSFDSGQHVGPRLFANGYFLTTTGGHFMTSGHALEVDGPYGWVKAIREQIKNGVDHIKLNLSGGIMGPAWDLHTHSFLLDNEIRAAFEICRKRGFKVMAHATNPEAVKNAIRLGAHSIEHGYIMDDVPAISQMSPYSLRAAESFRCTNAGQCLERLFERCIQQFETEIDFGIGRSQWRGDAHHPVRSAGAHNVGAQSA